MKTINTLIWDFNGTILDDVDLCLYVLNYMLKKRNLKEKSLEEYREIFGFPIKEYYEKAGFDFKKESYENLALEFVELYFGNTCKYNIFQDFINFQNQVKSKNITQILLSATKEDILKKQLKDLNVYNFFNCIIGTDDIFANGKIQRAKEFFKDTKLNFNNTLLIGDTIHDFHVSKELGCECILYEKGHQNKERLKETKCPVISSFDKIFNYITLECF